MCDDDTDRPDQITRAVQDVEPEPAAIGPAEDDSASARSSAFMDDGPDDGSDDGLDDRVLRLPPGEGYDDGELTRGDLDRPIGGYPLTDEEDREQQLRVYSEDGDAAVGEFKEYLAMVGAREPPW